MYGIHWLACGVCTPEKGRVPARGREGVVDLAEGDSLLFVVREVEHQPTEKK